MAVAVAFADRVRLQVSALAKSSNRKPVLSGKNPWLPSKLFSGHLAHLKIVD